ncbi:MAG: hypothetical protein JNK70_13280, partial [Phycisphaerae bacterium]|nr:hypothetical protein [Phycisphaerae bacterium]
MRATPGTRSTRARRWRAARVAVVCGSVVGVGTPLAAARTGPGLGASDASGGASAIHGGMGNGLHEFVTAIGKPPPDFDVNSITGRDFAGLRLPLAAVSGPIRFRANRAWSWTEDDRPTFAGSVDMPVHRLVLDGDVRVRLGFYEFASSRAVVWVQMVPGPTDVGTIHQVFLYLDRAETPEADATTSFFAERLPVRAVIDLQGDLELSADMVTRGRPPTPLVNEGEQAMARSLRAWLAPSDEPADEPEPAPRGELPPPGTLRVLPPAERYEPIFARSGIITVSPGNITFVSGETENSLILTDGVVVHYSDLGRGKSLRLNAQRAVVFLPPGPVGDMARLDVKDVRGIYLEGDVVATDGKYTLRGPRVYYDIQRNRAMVVDAVFWTYEAQRRLPFYLRAETIRQESANEFTATRARITSTAFFDPELSIGATSLTVRRVPRPAVIDEQAASAPWGAGPSEAGFAGRGISDEPAAPSDMSTIVDADHITLRAGGLPILYWPTFSGDPEQVPLRDIRIENSSGSGTALRTTWNAFGLLGLEKIEGLEADVMIDAYFERGIALGARLNWKEFDRRGSAFGYLVPYDTGTDLYSPGTEKDRDGQTRGIILADQNEKIDENWRLILEGAYISDESFIDAYFDNLGRSRREMATRANIAYRDESTYFSFEAKGTINDFIANEYLLQTPGYATSRTPEATYIRLFDDPIGSDDPELPGPILWTHEYRAGRLELQFDEPNADERGFSRDSLARRAFGIGRTQSIADRLRSSGYIEDGIFRADTRQQLDMPLHLGEFNVTPYTAGRVTVWDNDFSDFSPGEEDNVRFWYGAGARASTTFQRVDDSVDSRLFDLYRVRHIVTPYANLWQSGTNVDRVNLPVYDESVEGIAEGGIATLGIDQTWQTQRGKAGKWHSVDVFKLNLAYTNSSRDSDRESPIGRFIDYRPELSNVGNFFTSDGVWQVSDALALSGSTVFDTDKSQQARSSLGAIVQHAPDFSSFIEMRAINSEDATNLGFGQAYRFAQKYRFAWAGTYETNVGDFGNIGFELQRSLPTAELGFGINYDNISGETSFGFLFRPAVAQGGTARLR